MKSLKKISDRRLSLLLAFLALFSVLLVFLPVILFSINQVVKNGETRSFQWAVTGAMLVLGLLLFGGTYHFSRYILKTRRASQSYNERFQSVVDHSRDAMLQISRDFRIFQVNPASRELLGLQVGQTQSGFLKSILTFVPPLDENLLLQLCQTRTISEHHCKRRDGLELDLELSASVIPDSNIETFSLLLHDITDRKKTEALLIERNAALLASEERYMLAANGSRDGLWDWDLFTGNIYYSPRWKVMLGYHENELKPSIEEWFNRVHVEDRAHLCSQMVDHLSKLTKHFECEYRIASREGDYYWMLARGLAVWDSTGTAHRIAGSQTDITERKKMEEQLRYDAHHDGLTGMANRTLLLDHLKHVNDRKKRKPDLLFALFFLDLDRFKHINDSLGHQAGDQLLIETARRLENGLRVGDTISRFTGSETLARIAGDEFVILLEDFQTVDDIQVVAERVTKLFSEPFLVAGRELYLSASVGLVVPERPYDQVEDMIRDADIAMYQAKELGSGQVVRFQPAMYLSAIQRMQAENELRRAMEYHKINSFYKSKFSPNNECHAGKGSHG
jgi:diguanylate cyclase (GGDEF)-like protein/PAS domain S-box-containing protein